MTGRPGTGRQPTRITRDVEPEVLAGLTADPPRATLAWTTDDGAATLAPVTARIAGDEEGGWRVAPGPAHADLDGREVVLTVDDGQGWFELQSVTVRGAAHRADDSDGEPAALVVTPRRIVAWAYESLRRETDPPRRVRVRRRAEDGTAPSASSARELLRRGRVALVATVSARGRPFLVPLWFVPHRGRLYVATGAQSWTARNAAAHPQVSLLIGGEPGMPAGYLRIDGEAECRRGLPPLPVLPGLLWRYYAHPRRALGELRHVRLWPMRLRYYGQTPGGGVHLVIRPSRIERLDAPQRSSRTNS